MTSTQLSYCCFDSLQVALSWVEENETRDMVAVTRSEIHWEGFSLLFQERNIENVLHNLLIASLWTCFRFLQFFRYVEISLKLFEILSNFFIRFKVFQSLWNFFKCSKCLSKSFPLVISTSSWIFDNAILTS